MNLNKLRTILELASAELNDIANADQDKRMCAHARLGDALEAARRIGLPPGVDWHPERDGVDALVRCAEAWRDAAQRAKATRVSRLATEFRSMGLPQGVEWDESDDDITTIADFALAWRGAAARSESDAREWKELYANVSKQPGVVPE